MPCRRAQLDERRTAVRRVIRRVFVGSVFPPLYSGVYAGLGQWPWSVGRFVTRRASASLTRVLEATMSTTPTLHAFTAVTALPEPIGRLRELAP